MRLSVLSSSDWLLSKNTALFNIERSKLFTSPGVFVNELLERVISESYGFVFLPRLKRVESTLAPVLNPADVSMVSLRSPPILRAVSAISALTAENSSR